MGSNWTWAGGFLVLAFGGIGFGAKAGVESGRAALLEERSRAGEARLPTKSASPTDGAPVRARAEAGDPRAPADGGSPILFTPASPEDIAFATGLLDRRRGDPAPSEARDRPARERGLAPEELEDEALDETTSDAFPHAARLDHRSSLEIAAERI